MPRAAVDNYISWMSAYQPTRTFLLDKFRLDHRFVRAQGHHLWDVRGIQYLDFLSQFGAVSLGHNHPEIVEALREALDEQLPALVQPFIPVAAKALAERLAEVCPGDLGHMVFTNSGAESVEAAIKLVRAKTGKMRILSTHNGFHGKTLGALSATGNASYQTPFGAPVPGFAQIKYGDLDALEADLRTHGSETAAFVFEPVQGEGGVIVPPPGYVSAAIALCRRFGVLSVLDEIQTGLGRTGQMFALKDDSNTPDVLLLAKALGGGIWPIGACVTTLGVWDHDFGYLHSSTFANNNIGCRIGLRVLDILTRDNGALLAHVRKLSEHLAQGLRALQQRYPDVIVDIRVTGLLAAVELRRFDGSDSYTMAYLSDGEYLIPAICSYLLNVHGILTAPMFNDQHVLRIEPPFTVEKADIDSLLAALDVTCDALERRDFYEVIRCLCGDDSSVRGTCQWSAGRERSVPAPVEGGVEPTRFAFLMHYTDEGDIVEGDPSFRQFDSAGMQAWQSWASDAEPGVVDYQPCLRSAVGATAQGWLIALPVLPEKLVKLGRRKVMPMLREARKLAQAKGAQMLGLGGFTSIVSRGGEALVSPDLAITSGNSLTALLAVQVIEAAAARIGVTLVQVQATVIGGGGSIGRLGALMLAGRVARLVLVGNAESLAGEQRVKAVVAQLYLAGLRGSRAQDTGALAVEEGSAMWTAAEQLGRHAGTHHPVETTGAALAQASTPGRVDAFLSAVRTCLGDLGCSPIMDWTVDADEAVARSLLVLTATSSRTQVIDADALLPGTIVCDVGRPRNVARELTATRPDVLVVDGGIARFPEEVYFGVNNFGLPAGHALGCVSETVLLAFEGMRTDFSVGKELSADNLGWLEKTAARHGVQASQPLRFGDFISDSQFDRVGREHRRPRATTI